MNKTEQIYKGTGITVYDSLTQTEYDDLKLDLSNEEALGSKEVKKIIIVEYSEDFNKSFCLTNDEGFEVCLYQLVNAELKNEAGNTVIPTTEDIVQLWKEWCDLPLTSNMLTTIENGGTINRKKNRALKKLFKKVK